MSATYVELGLMGLALLAGGAATGLVAGLFGVGGGAVMVPVLYEVFGIVDVAPEVRMPLCVGTSLMAIIPTAISSYRKHLSKGMVDQEILKLWILPVLVGVIAGSLVARHAPAGLFKLVFVCVAAISTARLLFGNDKWKISDTLPSRFVMRIIGGVIGALSSLMGIGGGQISNIFMLLYGRNIHQAVSTSAGLGVLIRLAEDGAAAARVARLCLADRLCLHRAGQHLHGADWRPVGAQAAASQAGAGLRHLSDADLPALSLQPGDGKLMAQGGPSFGAGRTMARPAGRPRADLFRHSSGCWSCCCDLLLGGIGQAAGFGLQRPLAGGPCQAAV